MDNIAIFTMAKDEKVFFPIWYKYYSRYFKKQNIYVLDNETSDDSLDNGLLLTKFPSKKLEDKQIDNYDFIRIIVRNQYVFNEKWRIETVKKYRDYLISLGYDAIIFTDTDEILIPDPDKYNDLGEYLSNFVKSNNQFITTTGYEIYSFEDDKPIKLTDRILNQRKIWYKNTVYNKPLLFKPTIKLDWLVGFHETKDNKYNNDPHLILLHLHKMDYFLSKKRHMKYTKKLWPDESIQSKNITYYYKLNTKLSEFKFSKWFHQMNKDGDSDLKLEDIPEKYVLLHLV